MTRARMYGEDTPLGDWVRRHPDLDSKQIGLTVNDIDFQFHKYKLNIDGLGSRSVHMFLNLEAKTRGGMPSKSQHQTLFFEHQLLDKRLPLRNSDGGPRVSVWHFGYFVLSMPGDYPGQIGDTVRWCHFSESGELIPSVISIGQLVDVLAFRLNPLTLMEVTLRRHHKTSKIVSTEESALGFAIEQIVTRRS